MLDHPALDVAIGLIFLYIILALVCTTINEAISTAFGIRARFLQAGIINLLSGATNATGAGQATTKAIYDHPLVQGLIRPGHGPEQDTNPGRIKNAWRKVRPLPSTDPTEITKWWRRPAPYPSYLPSRTFISALTDLAAREKIILDGIDEAEAKKQMDEAAERITNLRAGLAKTIASIPNTRLSESLLAIYRSVDGDAERFHHAAEQWFDDSMERVSGWYKRHVQIFLFVIGSVVVLALNADSLAAGRVLWRDDAIRAAVVKQAEAANAANQAGKKLDPDQAVKDLTLPLGWGNDFTEVHWAPWDWETSDGWLNRLLSKLAGFAITILAIMLGAPFWFDLLSKVMRVRSTGAPPPATDAKRSGEGEQSRAGPTAND